MTTSIIHRITWDAQIRHNEHFDIRKRVSKISDVKEVARKYLRGGTLIFSYIHRLRSFLGAQNFEFQYFLGFSEKLISPWGNYIVSSRQMKQFEKQKEEFNGILLASVRTKMPSSDKNSK